jgi:hypothetical protein
MLATAAYELIDMHGRLTQASPPPSRSNFSVQVGVKATLGVPRYSGVADVVRGVKALSTRAKDTALVPALKFSGQCAPYSRPALGLVFPAHAFWLLTCMCCHMPTGDWPLHPALRCWGGFGARR